MLVDSLVCVRAKGGESEKFKVDNVVRRVYHVPLAFQCINGHIDGDENWDGMDGSEIP